MADKIVIRGEFDANINDKSVVGYKRPDKLKPEHKSHLARMKTLKIAYSAEIHGGRATCACCPRTDDLQLHHLWYQTKEQLARGEYERPEQLQLLCPFCHKAITNAMRQWRTLNGAKPKYNAPTESFNYPPEVPETKDPDIEPTISQTLGRPTIKKPSDPEVKAYEPAYTNHKPTIGK